MAVLADLPQQFIFAVMNGEVEGDFAYSDYEDENFDEHESQKSWWQSFLCDTQVDVGALEDSLYVRGLSATGRKGVEADQL